LSKWFQTERFLWEFPIGSYVKLSSAVAAILVGVLKGRTQFWKRTTQESFQQSLVEIGSVVSEKIFKKCHSPFFLICIIGQNRQKFKVHKKSCNICKKAHHYAYTVQIWAHSGLKWSSFGHLKKIIFLVMAAILDTGRC
jgi:hypothetical protein